MYGFTGKDSVPSRTANGYNVGNKIGETLSVGIGLTTYATTVYMPGNDSKIANWSVGKKEYIVGSNSGINSVRLSFALTLGLTAQSLTVTGLGPPSTDLTIKQRPSLWDSMHAMTDALSNTLPAKLPHSTV